MTGVVVAMAVWAVVEYILWPLVDEAASDAFTTWIFAVGHAVCGMVTALALYALSADTRTSAQTSPA
jgi:hypothetical protein